MLLEAFDQFDQRYPGGLTNLTKFDQIESSFAGFILRYKGLRFVQTDRKVFLAQPGTEAKLPQNALQGFLLRGEDALLHTSNKSQLTLHPNFGYANGVVSLWIFERKREAIQMQPALPFLDVGGREAVRWGTVSPFKSQLLKWIGNKQRFAHEIVSYFPVEFGRYYEPFLGSGAVLATLAPKSATGADAFGPLMEIWQALRHGPDQLKSWYGERHERTKSQAKEVVYEDVRASYNANPNGPDLLYLCRACYGGVVRFRKADGFMSTPCGVHKPISPASFAKRVEEWVRRCRFTEFVHAEYDAIMEQAKKGDLIYCDPPYVDTQTILYGAQTFSLSNLLRVIGRCKSKGVYVALSLDGTKRSGDKICNVPISDGLFETETSVNCGRSMLRRFQMAGQTLEKEVVSDRLLLTYRVAHR